jgi:hypothetical protein
MSEVGTRVGGAHGKPEADRVGAIEVRGIQVIPESDRHGEPRKLFFVWMTSNVTVLLNEAREAVGTAVGATS